MCIFLLIVVGIKLSEITGDCSSIFSTRSALTAKGRDLASLWVFPYLTLHHLFLKLHHPTLLSTFYPSFLSLFSPSSAPPPSLGPSQDCSASLAI